MDTINAKGGCQCGAVRYRVTKPPLVVALCHCKDCRVNAGAHAVAWLHMPGDGFQVTQGTPKEYRSSPPVRRTFCGTCGTTLTYWNDSYGDKIIDVTVGSLDEPNQFPPSKTVFEKEKVSWASAI